MKVAILAGGRGSRLGHVTRRIPKPMVRIGGHPILWHLMQHYSAHGFRDFTIAMGYLSDCIREYFDDAEPSPCDSRDGVWRASGEGLHVNLVDTGLDTATGGRIKRLVPHLGSQTFMLTWGDGLSDIDLGDLLAFHRHHGRMATVTAVHPPSRFGVMELSGNRVVNFSEKPKRNDTWINGAFFVLEPGVFDYIDADDTVWEAEPMERLAADGQLMAYRHEGFWQCMDTVVEWEKLERMWSQGDPPWKVRSEPEDGESMIVPYVHAANHSKPAESPNVLVTGHDGYIGKVLTPLLLDQGFRVMGFDSQLYRGCSIAEDSHAVPGKERDIRDVTRDELRGFDAVIHLAGLSNDPLGDLDPQVTHAINHQATIRLAAAAKAAGVKRFLQASTCSIYGASDNHWLTESSPFNPVTPYGRAKAAVEAELHDLADDDFSPTFLRFATAYGVSPRLRGDLVVNNLVGYAISTGRILLKSDGRAWRPIVHIEDIARALLAALRAPRERIHDQAFNVGDTAENYLVRDIASQIGGMLPEAEIAFADGAEPDRRNYRVNCDKLVRVLPDARPQWTLEAGIQQLIDTYSAIGLTREQLEGGQLQRLKRVRELQSQQCLTLDLRWNNTTATLRKAA